MYRVTILHVVLPHKCHTALHNKAWYIHILTLYFKDNIHNIVQYIWVIWHSLHISIIHPSIYNVLKETIVSNKARVYNTCWLVVENINDYSRFRREYMIIYSTYWSISCYVNFVRLFNRIVEWIISARLPKSFSLRHGEGDRQLNIGSDIV